MAAVLGAAGVLFGAFGAHGLKGVLSDYHYGAYRVGVEYLFFHLAPLLFISQIPYGKFINTIGWLFFVGILCFTGSNLLMTTEAVHHINFHFLWPITPLGGILFVFAWLGLAYYLIRHKG